MSSHNPNDNKEINNFHNTTNDSLSGRPGIIRTLFMGTPEFALPGLETLLNNTAFEIIGVYTRADKPIGRKQVMTPPPVKVLAQKYQVPIFQPEKIKPEAEAISALNPDLIVVIAYGKIIPQTILDIPKYGCINVHASLLPKYRGAACLNAPILNGDAETGVTIMQMDAGLDTGPILKQASISLQGTETLSEVHDRLSQLGVKALPETLQDWVAGKIKPQTQDKSQTSYVKMLTKEDGRLDWNKSAAELERMWRAFHPWPGVHAFDEKGGIIKFLKVKLLPETDAERGEKEKNGQILMKNGELVVKCGQDYLVILKLQTEGGRPLAAKEFLAGHQNFIGQVLR